MLHFIEKIGQLRYHQLVSVYAGSLSDSASALYRNLDRGVALQYAEQDLYTYLEEVFFKIPGAILAVWVEDGQYKSVLRMEPYQNGILITALETAPEERNRGFASKLLCAVKEQRVDFTLYSHVRRDNKVSLRCHEKAGFRRCNEGAVFLDGSSHPECVTLVHDGVIRFPPQEG